MTTYHHNDWFVQLKAKNNLGVDSLKSFTLGTVLKGVQIGRRSAEARVDDDDSAGLYASPVISREHAKLSVNAITGAVSITDDKSRHGTYINGLQIRRPVPIKQNDTISFGKSISKGVEAHQPIHVKVEINPEITFPLKKAETNGRFGLSKQFLEDEESMGEVSPGQDEHAYSAPPSEMSDGEEEYDLHDTWTAFEREHSEIIVGETREDDEVPVLPQPIEMIRSIDFTPSVGDAVDEQAPEPEDDEECSSCDGYSDISSDQDSERSRSHSYESNSDEEEEDDEEQMDEDKENIDITETPQVKNDVLATLRRLHGASMSPQPSTSVYPPSEGDVVPETVPVHTQPAVEHNEPHVPSPEAVADDEKYKAAAQSFALYMKSAEGIFTRLIGASKLSTEAARAFAENESTTPERIAEVVEEVEMNLVDEQFHVDEVIHYWRATANAWGSERTMPFRFRGVCEVAARMSISMINQCISELNTVRRHKQAAKIREAKLREQETVVPETVETQSVANDESEPRTEGVEIKIDVVQAPTAPPTPPPEASLIQSLASSAGMETPPRPLKRSHTETEVDLTPATPATPERPIKRARSVKTALGAFVIGSVIGSASTIAGLLQYAD